MLGVLHSPGHSNSIYIMGTTIRVVQIVWIFLFKSLISTGSSVSRSELFRVTFSIAKICVSFIKMFFLKFRVGCCLAKMQKAYVRVLFPKLQDHCFLAVMRTFFRGIFCLPWKKKNPPKFVWLTKSKSCCCQRIFRRWHSILQACHLHHASSVLSFPFSITLP